MWAQPYRKDDVEVGGQARLYPMMMESPELRWAFIRKIYVIISIQLLLTIAIAAVVVTVHPISHFFATTGAGLALYILLIIIHHPFYRYTYICSLSLDFLGFVGSVGVLIVM